MVITAAEWQELSLVPQPAFAGATISEVMASIHHNDEELDNNPDITEVEETEDMEKTPAPEAVEAAAIPTAQLFAAPKREFRMPSAAEYLAAMHIGGDTFR